MPTTPVGIEYPASSGHTRLWEHFETLATTADAAITAGVLFVRKPTAESVTSSTTMQNDDHLTLAVAANTTYAVELMLRYDGNANPGDFKFGFALPAGASFNGALTFGVQPAGTQVGGEATMGSMRDAGESGAVGALGTGVFLGATVVGNLLVAGTAGSFTLRWAQNSSSATATRVIDGSHLLLRKVA